MGKTLLAVLGAVGASVVSALCCVGPLVAVAVGVSGAGLAGTFEPLRPYFLGGTLIFLGLAHYGLQREERNACEPGRVCAEPRVRRRMKWILWAATVLAVLFGTFPYWSVWVLA
ncbi:MAG: mercury transporter MerT [Gemmatimonadetes bacterium]|nr:mercury transporter MerT [Gemmatimonadota bacterium]